MNDDLPPVADIRLATEGDADTVLKMMEAFNVFESIAFTPERLARGYRELMAHPEWGVVLLAEVGGVPAGYAVFAYGFDFEYGGRDAFLCELFVSERWRRIGVGRALLDAAEAFGREHGVSAVHLIVRRENTSAQLLYRRRGFQFDPRMLMTKSLAPTE